MPLLINRSVVAEDRFTTLNREALENGEATVPANGDVILPLAYVLENQAALEGREGDLGVLVNGDDDVDALFALLPSLAVVAVEFPVFRDGRGFSIARKVARAGFEGEIRAVGDVGRDRLGYMQSCGFNAFELNDENFSDDSLKAFEEITVNYQGTAADPRPIFRR